MSTGVGAGDWGAVGGVEALCFIPPTPGRSISQNSSILPEEEDEKSCTESELRVSHRRSLARCEEVRAPQNALVMSRGTWGCLGTRGSGWGLPFVALPPSLKMPEGDDPSLSNIPHPILRTNSSHRNVVRRRRAKTSPCHHREPLTSPRAPGPPSPPPSPPQKVQLGSRVLARQESRVTVVDPFCCMGMQRGFAGPFPTLPWMLH